MDRRFSYVSIISWISETKTDIITYANGNPKNQTQAKLSQINQDFLGSDISKIFVRRHHNELQRCSQFYSLASIYNETLTKDKHYTKSNNITKKYFIRLFRCFS
ncbi:unnamed protein product [Adineta steineri]|uniref:Uncharacterized protein n=1 Tax=Adineta steineri TaxID=433720 RepID=A0A813X9N9_9BILA|nr:unnamed protein product [Adineta steineri]CAF1432428.1 unnamed protein product [Adineta steineri]